jgi:hypothetical protein
MLGTSFACGIQDFLLLSTFYFDIGSLSKLLMSSVENQYSQAFGERILA